MSTKYNEGEWRWIRDNETDEASNQAWLPGKNMGGFIYEVEGRGRVKVTEAEERELDTCGQLMEADIENLVDVSFTEKKRLAKTARVMFFSSM